MMAEMSTHTMYSFLNLLIKIMRNILNSDSYWEHGQFFSKVCNDLWLVRSIKSELKFCLKSVLGKLHKYIYMALNWIQIMFPKVRTFIQHQCNICPWITWLWCRHPEWPQLQRLWFTYVYGKVKFKNKPL